ncbi:MAG: 5'-methylthioadenosine/S-adenosylhomocysteine nucleosidase [Proteobacteria bacterium]|nr:5'-methylthioadenosine/S-adenosylhomocysteine nucleosidase [Pseudomonadota bacterium]
MPEELTHLADDSRGRTDVGGLSYLQGHIAGREAVFVECGMGKVNAGVAAALMLDRFACAALMFCGVAGGLDPALGVGDVVVGTRNIQYDYGAEQEGGFKTYQPGNPPLPGFDDTHGYDLPFDLVERLRTIAEEVSLDPLPAAVGVGARTPVVRFGPIATGDVFVNSERTRNRLHGTYGALACEMEGGAVAQVAERFGKLPLVNVRCLSDLAGAASHVDFGAFLPVAAKYASQVAHSLAPHI